MKKAIATLLLTILAGALLIYSGARTLSLISRTLSPEQQVLGYFALAAFDGGIVLWSAFLKFAAHGAWQRGISALMVAVSLIGSVMAFGTDTLTGAGERGTLAAVDQGTVFVVVIATVVVVALNIAAVTLCHLLDPEGLRAAAEEEAMEKIEEATLRQIAENADSLASELAPVVGAAWVQRQRAAALESLPDDLREKHRTRVLGTPVPLLSAAAAPAAPSTNGHDSAEVPTVAAVVRGRPRKSK